MVKIVCLDRDGTVNKDENYYLGSTSYWKDKVELLFGVVDGIRLLNSQGIEPFIVTNQSGVALQGPEFDELTEERMHEVNRYILALLDTEGARVRGYFACPFVDGDYVAKAVAKGRAVNPDFVREGHEDLKPNTGMLEKCVASVGLSLPEVELYVIGDRKSDVELGLNGRGKGVLIASGKTRELGDVEKVEAMKPDFPGRIYIAKDFLDAVKYVVNS